MRSRPVHLRANMRRCAVHSAIPSSVALRLSLVPWLLSCAFPARSQVLAISAVNHATAARFHVDGEIRAFSFVSWLGTTQATLVVFGLMVVALAGIAWVAVLRRKLREQTELITNKLKNEMALE